MPKQTTKQEIINTINKVFYQIPEFALYNGFLASGGADYFINEASKITDDLDHQKTIVKGFFLEKVLPDIDEIKKLALINGVLFYMKRDIDNYREQGEEHYKENFRRLQSLINGCDSMEKLNMLKELPIMKE
tara:strand:+ start:2900 stop:3295 length:396 start_codon:yes stop_codon:yes gene_type:complete